MFKRMMKKNIKSTKFKLLNLRKPSLATLGLFLVTVLFISSFFYLKFETAANSYDQSRLVAWVIRANINGLLSSCGNEPVRVHEEGGDRDSYCDIFEGNWVWDDYYPLYKSPDCPFIDEGFRCSENGKPFDFYTKWRWQPKDCNLTRFDAGKMLGMLRNKRVVFAGDSISRNQWESLLCMLSTGVSNKSSIYEVNGNPITKHKGFLVFRFEDFNCTVEYYRSPFLVLHGRPPVGAPLEVKYALRVDQMDWSSSQWRDADLLILSSGRWWTYEKTVREGCNFQEGDEMKMNMNVEDAYRRSIETVVDWVNAQVNMKKTQVFFRTFSPSHFSGGNWRNSGCRSEMLPDLGPLNSNVSYQSKIVSDVLSQQLNSLDLLNVTNMATRRKDGHPSIYTEWPKNERASHHQDCSHWCLPGVPDSWNELLYAIFLKRELIREQNFCNT